MTDRKIKSNGKEDAFLELLKSHATNEYQKELGLPFDAFADLCDGDIEGTKLRLDELILKGFIEEYDIARYRLKESDTGTRSLQSIMDKPLPKVEYLLQPLIPKNAMMLLGAKPGCFKSNFALLIAMCIGSQRDFLGTFPCIRNPDGPPKILYYDLENGERIMHMRAETFANGCGYGFENIHLRFEFDRYKLQEELERAKKYDVIFMDSYRRFLPGDENDSEATDLFYQNFLKPLHEAGITVFIIAHFRKGNPEEMDDNAINEMFRGSSDQAAEVDLVFALAKSPEYQESMNEIKFDVSVMKGKNRLAVPLRDFTFSVLKDEATKSTWLTFKKHGHVDPNEKVREKVLDFLCSEEHKRKEIAEELDSRGIRISSATLDRLLERMTKDGEIIKSKVGWYRKNE